MIWRIHMCEKKEHDTLYPPPDLELDAEERFLYQRLTVDPESGLPLPFLSIEHEIPTTADIELLHELLGRAIDMGCTSCDVYEGFLYAYGQVSLTVDQLEVYESIMEKYRPWKRRQLENEIEYTKKALLKMEEDLDNFIWE